MKSFPKSNHFLPQFYLAGFTDEGTKNGCLIEMDRRLHKIRPAKPKDVAKRKNLCTIRTSSGENASLVEDALSYAETRWAAGLREIVRDQCLTPSNSDAMLDFLACLITRAPSFLSRLFASGELSANSMDKAFAFIAGGEIILPLFRRRNWRLGIVRDDAPDLVCSDGIIGLLPDKYRTQDLMASLDSRACTISFPLTRRLVMLGQIDKIGFSEAIDEATVLLLNRAVVRNSRQFIFLPNERSLQNLISRPLCAA